MAEIKANADLKIVPINVNLTRGLVIICPVCGAIHQITNDIEFPAAAAVECSCGIDLIIQIDIEVLTRELIKSNIETIALKILDEKEYAAMIAEQQKIIAENAALDAELDEPATPVKTAKTKRGDKPE